MAFHTMYHIQITEHVWLFQSIHCRLGQLSMYATFSSVSDFNNIVNCITRRKADRRFETGGKFDKDRRCFIIVIQDVVSPGPACTDADSKCNTSAILSVRRSSVCSPDSKMWTLVYSWICSFNSFVIYLSSDLFYSLIFSPDKNHLYSKK